MPPSLPLRTIIRQSKAWGVQGGIETYISAVCLDLPIVAISVHINPRDYIPDLKGKILADSAGYIATCLQNYRPPAEFTLSGRPDLRGVVKGCDKPGLLSEPAGEELDMLNVGLLGLIPLTSLGSSEVLRPKNAEVWPPHKVIMHFYRVHCCVDHTKQR